jgi:hypothetical protein
MTSPVATLQTPMGFQAARTNVLMSHPPACASVLTLQASHQELLLNYCKGHSQVQPMLNPVHSIMLLSCMQSVLLAAKPEIRAMSMIKGLILNAAAIDAVRTWITRIQEPLAGFANLLIPMWGIVPPSDPTRYHREPAEVSILCCWSGSTP